MLSQGAVIFHAAAAVERVVWLCCFFLVRIQSNQFPQTSSHQVFGYNLKQASDHVHLQSPCKEETAHDAQPITVSEAPARVSTVLQGSGGQNLPQVLRLLCSSTGNYCFGRLLQNQVGEPPNETSSLSCPPTVGTHAARVEEPQALPGGVPGIVLAAGTRPWSIPALSTVSGFSPLFQ